MPKIDLIDFDPIVAHGESIGCRGVAIVISSEREIKNHYRHLVEILNQGAPYGQQSISAEPAAAKHVATKHWATEPVSVTHDDYDNGEEDNGEEDNGEDEDYAMSTASVKPVFQTDEHKLASEINRDS